MFFIIQKDRLSTDPVQDAIILDLLHRYRYEHEYEFMSIEDFYKEEEIPYGSQRIRKQSEDFEDKYQQAIPVGTIGFVRTWLQIFKKIEFENAIEVPPILRTDDFLKRKYSIVPVWDIPRTGSFFVKDATEQKKFSYKGELRYGITDEMFETAASEYDTSFRFDYEHLYQVSELVSILAEYRVYVLQGKINTMSVFAGNPLVFPDAELIREAVRLYAAEPDSPRSFSLDVMVTPRGTAITDVHNFISLGIYTVDWDDSLLYALRDGMDYIIRYNTPQTEFSNFDTFRM